MVDNTSAFHLNIQATVNFKDADNNLIGTDDAGYSPFESGQSTVFAFSADEEYAAFDYEFSVSEESLYQPVVSDLECKTNIAKDKAVISITNNGEEAAEFVRYTALFFKGDQLVSFDWGYATDNDSEIKPGKTINQEAACYEDFDSVKVYLSGRR